MNEIITLPLIIYLHVVSSLVHEEDPVGINAQLEAFEKAHKDAINKNAKKEVIG